MLTPNECRKAQENINSDLEGGSELMELGPIEPQDEFLPTGKRFVVGIGQGDEDFGRRYSPETADVESGGRSIRQWAEQRFDRMPVPSANLIGRPVVEHPASSPQPLDWIGTTNGNHLPLSSVEVHQLPKLGSHP